MADHSSDHDPEAAMREMMGFSNFGTSGSKARSKKEDGAGPSQAYLSGANTAPLSKRLKPSPSPSFPLHSKPNTDPRPKSTSPAPYIPPAMYPSHILPPRPTTTDMISQASSGLNTSAGPTAFPAGIAPTGEATAAADGCESTGSVPRMTTYNAFTNPSTPHPSFKSQDVRFAPTLPPVDAAPATENEYDPHNPARDYDPRQDYSPPSAHPDGRTYNMRDPAGYTKKNEKGDTVYFQPSFIVDDPWEHLRGLTTSRGRGDRGRGERGRGS